MLQARSKLSQSILTIYSESYIFSYQVFSHWFFTWKKKHDNKNSCFMWSKIFSCLQYFYVQCTTILRINYCYIINCWFCRQIEETFREAMQEILSGASPLQENDPCNCPKCQNDRYLIFTSVVSWFGFCQPYTGKSL